MSNKFIKSGDASTMLEPYLSVVTKGSCSNDEDGLFLVKDFDPRMSYVASPISGKLISYTNASTSGFVPLLELLVFSLEFNFSFRIPLKGP